MAAPESRTNEWCCSSSECAKCLRDGARFDGRRGIQHQAFARLERKEKERKLGGHGSPGTTEQPACLQGPLWRHSGRVSPEESRVVSVARDAKPVLGTAGEVSSPRGKILIL